MTVLSFNDSDEALERLGAFYGTEKTVTIEHGNLIEGLNREEKQIPPLIDFEELKQEWPRLRGMICGAYSKYTTQHLRKCIILLHNDILPNFAKHASVTLCI